MHWIRHYTGIDWYQGRVLYLQRDTTSKHIQYVRVDLGAWYGFGWRRVYQGHIFWINAYRKAPVRFSWLTSLELLSTPLRRLEWREVYWHGGSVNRPSWDWSLGYWRVRIGGGIPKFLYPRVRRRQKRKDDAAGEAYEQYMRARGWNEREFDDVETGR